MAGLVKIQRSEIWTADLRPGVGFEVAKTRPSLVISSDSVNQTSPVIVVIPLSSRINSVLGPERVLITKNEAALTKDSVAIATQIRSIDKSRLKKKIGKI